MEQSSPTQSPPVACDLSAIPPAERASHISLIRSLFGDDRRVRSLSDGLEVSVEADRFADVAAFIDNERRCCPHLSFALEVPLNRAPVVLRVTGPGAAAELRPPGSGLESPSGR